MAEESFRVRPFYRLVANGYDGSHLKATLIITPEPAMAAGDGFPLEDWPSKMAQILRGTELGRPPRTGEPPAHLRPNIEVRIGREDASPVKPAAIDFIGHGSSSDADWTRVTALWKKALLDAAVFVRPDGTRIALPKPWATLGEDIKQSLTGGKHAADPKGVYQGTAGGTPPGPEKFDQNGAIVARRPSPSEKITVVGVVANGQSDLALDEERVRAQRLLRKMVAGPGLPGDDAVPLDEMKPDDPPPGYTTDPEENEKRFKSAVRKRAFSDFTETVAETNSSRARTSQQFTDIKKILEKKTEGAAVALASHRASGLQPVAPAGRITEGLDGQSLRAGHAYGGWLQSVKKSEEVKAGTPYRAHATAALTADQATALEQMRGVYYSLQGDVFLSRLFCLTVDLRLACPPELTRAPSPAFVYLAAERCDEKRLTAQVMTAAKYDGSSFWPVSRFEVSDANVDVKSLVEQEAGLWKLGSGYGTGNAHNPRYDLASLDYRRSVDATHDAIDHGQRQITAGFTILDRGRAEQIARDLAISAVQSAKVCDQADNQCKVANRHCVVLWAEELTIGRRLDVTVVKDSCTLDELEWRGLMHRQTEFEVEPAVLRILRQVARAPRDNNRFDEETSFQVVTRSMPLLGKADDADRSVEAIADEALVMWDGTPLAALVHAGPDTSGSSTLRLPFTRRHHLGTSGHRPPPLRYGVGYAFSMRSVFLGGGSPPVKALAAAHNASNGQMMLPPAVQTDGKYVPARTRFLRHEGIDAPQVLLPEHLADKRHGPMGFEVSDRAIVRRKTATYDPLKETPDRYVSLDERSQPQRSMRVFVAPIAPLETVIRHRKLDKDGTSKIRGGLQTVLFDPGMDGFPVAHTFDAPEFNGARALVSRKIVQNKTRLDPLDKKSGAAVFTAGGKNHTPANGIGYLPDPAAEVMVVRVRVRGSDRYLDGAFMTDVYDEKRDIRYPHALPLVVSIERQEHSRAKPAAKFGEILYGDPKAVVSMTRDGRIVAGASGAGTRVRHVTVRLAPGEDFDLEVTCLPKVETLAQCFAVPETIALQLRYASADSCAADDLSCLCGPLATARLTELRQSIKDADAPTDPNKPPPPKVRGLGGWPVPTFQAIKAVAKALIDTMQSRWQIEELAAVQQLRVCHAINAPLTPPQVVLTGVNRPLVKDGAKRTEIAAGPNAQGAQAAVLQGKVKIDLEQIDAFEIVVTTAPTGAKVFDDKNRSRSLLARRAGRWPEAVVNGGRSHYVSTRDVLGFTVAADGRVTLPTESVTLLRVGNLPDPRAAPTSKDSIFTPGAGRLTEIDLGALHAAGLANSAIDVPVATVAPTECGRTRKITTDCPLKLEDARARKLKVKLVGISRSSPLFQTTAFYAGNDNALKQRQALAPEHQVLSSVETEVWIKSTVRPSRCDARPPTPMFRFERSATREQHTYHQLLKRTAKTRLHFGRGMFDSGEGERIGIVLWPPAYLTQTPEDMAENKIKLNGRMVTLNELDDADLGPGGKFITRWGGDPIRKDISPQTGNFIPVKEFIDLSEKNKGPHSPIYVASAQMPVHVSENVDHSTGKVIPDPNVEPEFLEVSLVTYEPCFDIDREEWYIDVDLHPALATDPFVRFGLVRYQEQCIKESLKVSEPVIVWAQLLPERTVKVEHRHEGGNVYVKATVGGQASDGTKSIDVRGLPPLKPEQEATRRSIQRPVMQMTIVHEGSANGIATRTLVWQAPPIEARPSPDYGLMQWKFDETTIAATRLSELGDGNLVAYIEEIERRMPATYAKEPITPGRMLESETILSSGPRFNARVVFSVQRNVVQIHGNR